MPDQFGNRYWYEQQLPSPFLPSGNGLYLDNGQLSATLDYDIVVTGDKAGGTKEIKKMNSSGRLIKLLQQRAFGSYFCGAQARIYMNGQFIDEIVEIEGVYDSPQIPIYGYASNHFNTVASGKVIVQGAFTINYKYDGYLWTLLKKGAGFSVKPELNKDKSLMSVTGSNDSSGNNTQETQTKDGRTDILNNNDEMGNLLYGNITDEDIIALREKHWGNTRQNTIDSVAGGNALNNLRPEFRGPINIDIRDFRLGEGTGTEEGETKTIFNAFLTRYSTLRRADGSPVVEVYAYIAQTFI